MSHFSVMVIGDNVEEQLAPYNENLEVEFKDTTAEYRAEYEDPEKTRQEFYCESSSSWGMEVSELIYNLISPLKVGDSTEILVGNRGVGSYFKNNRCYKCYFQKDGSRKAPSDEDYVWIKVDGIVATTHPDPNVCFEGVIKVCRIEPPRRIPLSEYYSTFEQFVKD